MANHEYYGSGHTNSEFQPAEGTTNVINVGENERIVSAALGAFFFSSGFNNLFRHPLKGLIRAGLGGYLLYRGITGHCLVYSSLGKTKDVKHTPAINIRTSLIVNKPKDEVYNFWRKLENLPLFMKHISNVTEIDNKHSHWEAVIPGNIGKIKWNAEIVKEEPGYLIGWQSIPNSTINNAGKVIFHDALGGQGTELEVVISYHAPAGELGSGLAQMLNPVFEKVVRQDVMNFKDYIENKHTENALDNRSAGANRSSATGMNTENTNQATNNTNS